MILKKILWIHDQRKDGTCPVKIYVNRNGKVKYKHTRFFVRPEDWEIRSGHVKKTHPMHTYYNARIGKLLRELEEHLLEGGTIDGFDSKVGIDPDRDSLVKFGWTFVDEAERGLHNLSAGTLKNYRSTLRRLEQYAYHKSIKTVCFQDINADFHSDFSSFLEQEADCKLLGIAKHIKIIKRLMNVSLEKGLHKNDAHQGSRFKAYRNDRSNKIFLTEKEIGSLERLDLSNQPSLERERDRFLVSYYLLLRYSDSTRLRRENFFEREGNQWVRMIHQKTGIEVICPVKPIVVQIMEKYDYRLKVDSNQVANRKLKTICALAGINQMAAEGNRQSSKSQLVSTHTARRSAATNLYLQGMSLKVIADLGGWKKIDTLALYLRGSGLDSAQLASNYDFFK